MFTKLLYIYFLTLLGEPVLLINPTAHHYLAAVLPFQIVDMGLSNNSFRNLYNRLLYVTGLYMCDPWEQRMCCILYDGNFLPIKMS